MVESITRQEKSNIGNSKKLDEIFYITKNTIMAGIYIAIGTILYLAIPNRTLAPFLFPLGILLVTNYHSMMVTRVVPMYLAKLDYKFIHIPFAIVGNIVGAVIPAFFISYTRLVPVVRENLNAAVHMRMEDNLLSVLIMSVFCGILVAYSTFTSRKYKKGSLAQIFYTAIFITAFVFCMFDHIVAIAFFYGLYGFINGFSLSMFPSLIVVLIGNIIGGVLVALAEKKNLDIIETRRRYDK